MHMFMVLNGWRGEGGWVGLGGSERGFWGWSWDWDWDWDWGWGDDFLDF